MLLLTNKRIRAENRGTVILRYLLPPFGTPTIQPTYLHTVVRRSQTKSTNERGRLGRKTEEPVTYVHPQTLHALPKLQINIKLKPNMHDFD